MKALPVVIVAPLCAVLIGCLIVPIPGNPLPLAAKSRPDTATALLPLSTEQVKVFSKEIQYPDHLSSHVFTTEGCAADVESALTTLARGSQNPLWAPGTVSDRLKGAPEAEALHAWLRDPTVPGQEAALASVAEKLGTQRVVRVCATVHMRRDSWGVSGYPFPVGIVLCWWGGNIEVTAELWDLCPPRMIASSKAKAACWGSFGNPLFYVGHAVWRPSRAAATQATREALVELFAPPASAASP